MKKLRIAIVGCGGIANQKHMPAIKKNADKAELVAFCDIIKERADKAAKEYGTADAKVYTDYKEMLADKDVDIDVVHVCTPNVAHCPITVAAFEAGKHVMCEKPMAHCTEDAKKMIDAQWLNAILNDTDPLVRPEQAFVVTQILEGIYKSAETGKEVFFD